MSWPQTGAAQTLYVDWLSMTKEKQFNELVVN